MLVGAVLLAIGIVGLLWPITPDIGRVEGSVSCNNALMLDTDTAKKQETTNAMIRTRSQFPRDYPVEIAVQCEDTAQIRRIIFWPAFGIGLVTLVSAFVIRPRPEQEAETPDPTPTA